MESCINTDVDCRNCVMTIGTVVRYVEENADEKITEWSNKGTPCESVISLSFGQTKLKETIDWNVDNTDHLLDEQNHESVYGSAMYLLAIQVMRKKFCMYVF